MARWKIAFITIISILVIIVVAQNTQAVETRLLFVTLTMPRAVLLFVTLVIGFVIGLLVGGRISRPAQERAQATDGEQA